ncbi:MAG TPA: hypothetical protein DIS79_00020 [Bacteroidetes bacterium]|nr:hypothetical protein [Bacteroidota bacterium]HRK04272.1 squalene/phytoene synthase family protein [Chlorobiota bacterium]
MSTTIGTAAPAIAHLCEPDGGRFRVGSDEAALAWCQRLAYAHYENFPVASFLLPRRMRRPTVVVYAFARTADDIGDEPWTDDVVQRRQALDFFDAIAQSPGDFPFHPIARALSVVRRNVDIPAEPLCRLVEAFRRDTQSVTMTSWNAIIDYTHHSADPVGELVLRIAGVSDPTLIQQSDAICSALQVVNFLQDLSVDLDRGRRYIPPGRRQPSLEDIEEAIVWCEQKFSLGRPLLRAPSIPLRLRLELRAIVGGGMRMLQRCKGLKGQLLTQRPRLRRSDYFWAFFS